MLSAVHVVVAPGGMESVVTGTVAAKTAIGTLDASMLDTATTRSITNSMNVSEPALPAIGWISRKVQASP